MEEDPRAHILHKPFGRKDLAAVVREILDDGTGAKAAAGVAAEDSAHEAQTG
jgi:hypothetical protein